MANYNLVVGSKFKPYSFEEYIAPYKMYDEVYQAQEAVLDKIATEASIMESIITEEKDKELYDQYQAFKKDLESKAGQLSKYGLNSSNRRDIIGMKSRYDQEIAPIENAFEKRQNLINQQRDALLGDDTLIFDIDYSTVSLKDFMKNPNATFTSLSGESIAKRTAAMAKEAADAILSDPEYKSVFNKQYVQQKIKQGYDMSQIIAAAQRDPNAPKALLGIIETIKKQVGYDKWSKANKTKIDGYINDGLKAAVETSEIDVMTDRDFKSKADEEREKLQADLLRAQIEEAKGLDLPGGGKIIKLGGGKFTEYDSSGKLVRTNAIPTQEEEEEKEKHKAEVELNKKLSSVVKVSDMKGTGFTPVGVVAKIGGSWQGSREGEDIPNTLFGFTRTNLKSTWGNFSYAPNDSSTEATVVTNMETIPGFKEWINGSGDLLKVDESTAFGQIVQQARLAGITDEEFQTDNVIILKVKAKGSRASSGSPYDYIIYRKS